MSAASWAAREALLWTWKVGGMFKTRYRMQLWFMVLEKKQYCWKHVQDGTFIQHCLWKKLYAYSLFLLTVEHCVNNSGLVT